MPLKIGRANRSLVHQEDNLSACLCQRRPLIMQDGFLQCLLVSTDLVRSNDFGGLKYRTNLGIEGIERGRSEFFCCDGVVLGGQIGLLGLKKNIERKMF